MKALGPKPNMESSYSYWNFQHFSVSQRNFSNNNLTAITSIISCHSLVTMCNPHFSLDIPCRVKWTRKQKYWCFTL